MIGIGEVLWDQLPDGKQLGGAPANFAFHAKAMGANVSVISRVGDDPLGREVLQRMFALGVPGCDVMLDSAHPTGVVEVEIGADGQPRYVILPEVAWDYIAPEAMDSAASADAICFGTLAQRNAVSRNSIHTLLDASRTDALRVLDVNLRQDFYTPEILSASLDRANVLKLNDAELKVLARIFSLHGDLKAQIATLAERFQLQLVACTRGEKGSLLYAKGEWSEREAEKVAVKDTIGAGDSFAAAITMGLLLRWPLPRLHAMAAEVASFVCSQAGAMPEWPAEMKERFGVAEADA